MKQLVAWVIGFKNSYRHRVFLSTWVNIIVFHTFYVLVLAVVFYYTLEYAKKAIFTSIAALLTQALNGVVPDPLALDATMTRVDEVIHMVLAGSLVFAVLTAIAAAYITLKPTRRALAVQKKFVSSVAHELRTPLSVMRTNNEVALYDIDQDSPAREIIQENIQETIHLGNVLNNLLIFSRVDTTETMPFEAVDINAVVDTVIKKLQNLADRKKVQLTSLLGPDSMVHGNQAALEQTLYNIVKNAIAYSKPSGALVHIQTTTNSSNSISVSVIDNGVGINKKDLPHIFSPFFRVNEDRGRTDSMGLGLALVYEVMKLHQGNISVQSEVDKGTTMTLTLRRPMGASQQPESSSGSDTIQYNFGKH